MMKKVGLESLIARQEGFSLFSRELLEKRQLELLNMQLFRAKKSPFYADYPESLDSLSDLSALPFTTPQMLKDNFSRLCLLSPDKLTRLRTQYTSGTSGNPKRVAYSKYDCDRTLDFFENGLGEFIYPGDTAMICLECSDSLSLGGLIATAVRRLGAVPVCAGTGRTFGEYISLIKEHNVTVYLGTPVLLLSLLRLMDSRDTLRRALVTADYCSNAVETACEKLLESRLFPHYGLRESGLGCALTCSAHEGLHVRENDVICEITAPDGTVLPQGDWGELVITTVGMEALPLFRYKTGDFARILPGICPCGSEVLRIEVEDRIQKSPGIGHYDDLIFPYDSVIDFSINGNTVTILVKDEINSIKTPLRKLLRGFDVRFQTASLSDKPMYAGKRRIL